MSQRSTYFHGGPLDGQRFPTMGATYYLHDLKNGKFAEYKRLRTVYADGKDYANEANRERLSHLEYKYTRLLDKP